MRLMSSFRLFTFKLVGPFLSKMLTDGARSISRAMLQIILMSFTAASTRAACLALRAGAGLGGFPKIFGGPLSTTALLRNTPLP